MSTPSSPSLVGQLLDGRYEVLAHIADGGMASVYVATDHRLDRPVAVKVMRRDLAGDEAFVARFRREARSAARLSHPNVVGVFDQGQDGENVFLAMELVRGRTLRELIRADAPLTARAAIDIMDSVLQALAAAHRAGIVHRDVKPENVLLGDDGVVKVADFGLARAITTETLTTNHDVLLGTAAYLSPEQVEHGVADTRSDVYSATLILHELLTGEKAFGGDSPIHVAYQHVHGPVPVPSQVLPGVPERLDELVALGAAKDPAQRPGTATDLLLQLRSTARVLDSDALDRDAVSRHDAPTRPRERVNTATRPIGREDRPTPRTTERTGATGPDSHGAGGGAVRAIPTGERTEPGIGRPTDRTGRLARPATGTSKDGAGGNGASGNGPRKNGTGRSGPGGATRRPDPSGTARTARARRRSLLVGLLVAALFIGGGTGWWFTLGPGGRETVPTVAGISQGDAVSRISAVGLEAQVEQVFHESVPAGRVVSSSPAAGADQGKSDPVVLRVSKGPERYTVPELVGSTRQVAQQRLAAVNLRLGPVTEAYHETVPSGSVISSTPARGDRVKRDSAVALTVSQGRQPITVPDVTSLPVDQARTTLEGRQLTVAEADRAFSDTVPEGSVISQTPSSGTLFRSETVTLTVSKGPEKVAVPRVVDSSTAEARRTLEAAGLKVKVSRFFGGLLDTVRGQDPAAGTEVPKGTTVTISVV